MLTRIHHRIVPMFIINNDKLFAKYLLLMNNFMNNLLFIIYIIITMKAFLWFFDHGYQMLTIRSRMLTDK